MSCEIPQAHHHEQPQYDVPRIVCQFPGAGEKAANDE